MVGTCELHTRHGYRAVRATDKSETLGAKNQRRSPLEVGTHRYRTNNGIGGARRDFSGDQRTPSGHLSCTCIYGSSIDLNRGRILYDAVSLRTEDHHAIRERHRGLVIVGHHEDAGTLLGRDSTQKASERVSTTRIHVGEGLIEKKKGGPWRQGSSQSDALLLAPR